MLRDLLRQLLLGVAYHVGVIIAAEVDDRRRRRRAARFMEDLGHGPRT